MISREPLENIGDVFRANPIPPFFFFFFFGRDRPVLCHPTVATSTFCNERGRTAPGGQCLCDVVNETREHIDMSISRAPRPGFSALLFVS